MTTLSVAITRIRAWVSSAKTRGTNHYRFEGSYMLNLNVKHLKRELYTIRAIESWIDGIIFECNHMLNVNVRHLKKRALNHDNTQYCRDQDSSLGFLGHNEGY
jgi:hypothetical protein